MKIAITSSNGKDVDTHFGKANMFYVYELTPGSQKLIEARSSENYCSGETGHGFMAEKLQIVYEIIKDCEMLCTAKIGETPAEKLQEKGINIVEFEGDLVEMFKSL